MVEVFRTNIGCKSTALHIISELQAIYPLISVNFDLDDRENILRIKGDGFQPEIVEQLLRARGYMCEMLV
jgi:hypothetical protein